ncbi:MAG: ABC transporter permease [Burkholderiales bacterium]
MGGDALRSVAIRVGNAAIAVAGVAVFFGIWWLAAVLEWVPARLLPDPWRTLDALWRGMRSGGLPSDLGMTLYRAVTAFAIATAIGIPLGILLGSMKRVYRSTEALIDFFRSTPATAMFPLFLIIFGIGDVASLSVAVFACALVIVFNSAYGVFQARLTRISAARIMGASRAQILRHVLFFDALPQIFVGIRTAVSLSLVIIVVAEMFIGARSGIGKRIIDAQIVFDLPLMYAAILLSGAMGYGLNLLLVAIEKRVIHWSGT